MELKVCTVCEKGYPKTLEYFYSEKRNRNGLQSKCKKCSCKSVKLSSSSRTEQRSIYNKQYYSDNKEQRCENTKKWIMLNKEHSIKYSKEYKETHKNEISLYNKKYRTTHSVKLNERNKKYRNTHLEKITKYIKQYKAENKDKINNINQNRRAKIKDLDFNYTLEHWEQCKEHFNNKCAYCGKDAKLTREHFIPLIRGGEYTINNIIPVCSTCNSSKNDTDFFEWYPKHNSYSEARKNKILKYLNYNNKIQQLAFII